MERLPTLSAREVMRALERAGFSHHHIRGSHYYFKVRDHRVESGRILALMKPSERGLLPSKETRHRFQQDMIGRHGPQTARLLQG
jgi:predicted RNA binding protein YcfA (HicA-like mRNA interferase family)